MCASYGLTSESRRRKAAERRRAKGNVLDIFDEPEFFSEKVEFHFTLPDSLDAWLEEKDQGAGVKFGTTRSAEAGPFSPLITAPGEWELSWWWFWENGAPIKDGRLVFNAKSENLRRGLWKEPFETRRVLIPASYYFETSNVEGPNKGKRFRFSLPGEDNFAIAGISALIEGAPVSSCFAMVTRPPTEAAAVVHNRMPLSLPEAFHETWLDPDVAGDKALVEAALGASEDIVHELQYERA